MPHYPRWDQFLLYVGGQRGSFSFLRYDSILMRLTSRIILLPVVADLLEIIRFTGKHRDFFLALAYFSEFGVATYDH